MTDENKAHETAMKELQAEHREKIKSCKASDRGLVLVNTGDGKGKSTAAFGTIVRALGWGHSVAVVQFIKGNWKVGEREFFKRFDDLITWHTMGEGFTWDTQDRERDIEAAESAWSVAKSLLVSGDYDLVVLDELNIALRYDYLDIDNVLGGLKARDNRTSVIVTGRNAKEPLIEYADLVSNVEVVKHPFDNGIKAKQGLDF
jgi:cob(I)alamin adenosyltransferase